MTGGQVSMLVFGLNSGAYISEMMRAGIESVDPGQMEAGRAVGLSFSVTMIKIVIPQAVKNILPTLGYEFMVPYLVMALIYIVIVLLISLGIKLMERSLKKSDRRN